MRRGSIFVRRGRRRLVVATLLVVGGVVFILVYSTAGQWPSDAPTEEQPKQEEAAEDVVTPRGGLPADLASPGVAGDEEALEDRPPEQ